MVAKLVSWSRFVAAVALALGASLASAQPVGHDQVQASGPDSAAVPSSAPASDDPAQVKSEFLQRFPGIQVDGVRKTPFNDLFEVQIGSDLVYTNAKVSFVMQGALIDAATRVDLTARRLDDLSRVSFDQLPLDQAIKQVKGDGSRVLVAFEDPNCGYCKQLHRSLQGMDNVTVYTLLYPILSPDSHDKARDIWCADNPAAAWKSWMVDGVRPVQRNCDTPIEKNLALGKKLGIQGTPALYFADGSRVNGALPAEGLEAKFAQIAQAKKSAK